MNKIVYHYCSINTFLQIIQNKSLRLCDITKSNDRKEIIFLQEAYNREAGKYSSKKHLQNAINFFVQQEKQNTIVFSISFSKEKDSLYMWNCYSRGGVSLGFDISEIKDWSKKISVIDGKAVCFNSDGCMSRCGKIKYYSKDRINKKAKEQFKDIKYTFDPSKEFLEKAVFIKTDFWKIENEWRIVVLYHVQDPQFGENDPFKNATPIGYTDSKEGLREYIEVKFEPKMLKEIILAPDCQYVDKEKKEEIREFIIKNGFEHVQISNSRGSLI